MRCLSDTLIFPLAVLLSYSNRFAYYLLLAEDLNRVAVDQKQRQNA
jgi:hypothetical protein